MYKLCAVHVEIFTYKQKTNMRLSVGMDLTLSQTTNVRLFQTERLCR